MKKLLLILCLILLFTTAGCQKEITKSSEGWALWAVETGYDDAEKPQMPYIIVAYKSRCVFDENINDGESDYPQYACYIVTIHEDLDGQQARERNFSVFIGWIKTYTMRVFQMRNIPESAIKDIDVIEVPKF